MLAKTVLAEILKDLSSKELEEFNFHVELEESKMTPSAQSCAGVTNPGIVVELMEERYGEEWEEVAKNVFKKMNRTDLVQRFSDSSSGTKEEHSVVEKQPSLTQRVERITSDIQLLMDILSNLTKEEVKHFTEVLLRTDFKRLDLYGYWFELLQTEYQEIVFLIVMALGQHSVETTREVLKNMKRTDLLQRLTDASSRSKKGHPDEPRPALIQKVAMMAAVRQMLLDTLHCLSEEELQNFTELLEQRIFQMNLRPTAHVKRLSGDRAEKVDLMLKIYGQQSVKLTREILEEMKRTDLTQILSETSSESKEKQSVDEHQHEIQMKALREDVKWTLFKTMLGLSDMELEKFRFFLKFTYFQRSCPLIYRWRDKNEQSLYHLVDLMGDYQQPVEVTMEVLMDMNRADLVDELSGTISRLKEEQSVVEKQPSLTQRVERMTSYIHLLMDILSNLTKEEVKHFTKILLRADFKRLNSYSYQFQLLRTEYQEIVFLIVTALGQHSVETTREVLKNMKRTDLLQRLTDASSRSKKGHPDEPRPALIQKVAMMVAVRQMLLDTLHCLSEEELQNFTELLQQRIFQMNLRPTAHVKRLSGDREEKVDLMLKIYGQQSVKLTREILEEMKRTDLTQMLSETSSESKEKQSVDKHQHKIPMKALREDVKWILYKTLWGLSNLELEKFRFFLRFIYFQSSCPLIYRWINIKNAQYLYDLVNVMGDNQQTVEVTMEVLMDMNRADLVDELSGTISRLKEGSRSAQLQQVTASESLHRKLLKTLTQKLRFGEFAEFKKLVLHTATEKGLKRETLQRIEKADTVDMVHVMVEIYGQQCVEETLGILRRIKRTDPVGKLPGTGSGLKTQSMGGKSHKLGPSSHFFSFPLGSEKSETDFTMTADHQQLLETLGELSVGELEKFKHVLQYTKMKGLPKIPRDRLETTDKLETVKLMVEIYGEQSVEVTRDVLKRIYRMELVQKLSQGSPESQEPSRSLGPEACGYNLPPWTKLEPGVNSIGGDESPTYSLECDTGNYFECSVSGLRWVCKEKVSFQYQFCSWEGHMERMENINYMPAGPLMNIRVITGKFHELYLPHWICTDDNPDMLKEFAVLHIDDCGDVVESVAEVTPSHVKLLEPVFSPRAALMKVGFPVKISCSVLIYYKPNTPFLKLHVYVIPCDPALQRTVDQKEEGFQKIKKPRPDGYLKMQQGFSLTADIESAKIYPEKITLRYDNQDPNFYEVFIEKPDGNFTLELSQMSKGRALSQKVWSCEIRKVDYQCLAPEEKHSVDHQLSALVQKSVTITTTDRERLLKILEQLEQTELKRFKWFLQNTDLLADLPSISPSELENKDRLEMVDLMLRVYSTRSIELSKKILEKMPRNDLVQALSDIS